MNLIPIDTGGTPTELISGGASPGGDFAALMSGLMTGDTQIVPLIDIPTGEQLPEGVDTAETDETGDITTSILEFIGSPPAGLKATPLHRAAQTEHSNEEQEPIGDALVAAAPLLDSKVPSPQSDTTIHPADGEKLATVHPIRTHVANTPSPTSEADAMTNDPVVTGLVGDGRREPQQSVVERVSTEPTPEITVAPSSRPSTPVGAEQVGTTPVPVAETPVTPPATWTAAATTSSAATPQGATDPTTRQRPTPEQAGGDAHLVESDVDADIATAARPVDTVRSGLSITQPAMVGIARRVEEAIAALATKPDPKIVTLQLDELDGLRLTVALRPDGIHLSSSGDATLTTEIERALASRGFDLASGSDRGRQGSEDNTDDGWRPPPATPGRQPSTNRSGIRL